MRLLVNGEAREVEEGLTVAALLAVEGEPAAHVLVEINDRYLPAVEHGSRQLRDGDRVEFILPAFGG